MPKTAAKQQKPSLTVDYTRLFDSLPGGIIAFAPNDPDFTIIAENRAHAEVAMVQPADVIGKPVLEAFPDTSEKYLQTGVSDLVESLRKVVRSKQSDPMDVLHYDLKDATGQFVTRYWRVTHYPVFDEAGEVCLVYQATEDITEEVMTGNQMSRIQKQLDEALTIGRIGTWLWDVVENKVIGDKNMANMFNVSAEDAATGVELDRFVSAIDPDDRERVMAEIAAAIKSGETFHSEYRTIGRDGTYRWLIARGRIERNDAGEAIFFPGVLVDITERKMIENNLEHLARASAILSASLDYTETLQSISQMLVPDIADWCTIDMLNPETGQLELVGLAHKDPAKVKWARELRRQQGPPNLSDPTGVAEVIRSGKPQFYPIVDNALIEATAKPDEIKLLKELELCSIIMVPLAVNQKVIGVITLILTGYKRYYTETDLDMAEELAIRASNAISNAESYERAQNEIRERNRLEEALRQANDELEQRVEERTLELEETNLSLQRSNQELQDFAYVASHDLQEPLRKIQAFGNLLETEYAAKLGDGKDYLDRMRNAAARMSSLIEDILSFSRVTTKGREFVTINLHTIVQEVVSDLEIRIADTKGTVEIGDLPTIQADPTQMRQLMQNLIANALKFHRDDVPPVIKVRASTEMSVPTGSENHAKMKFCKIEVEDNGLGFDEKYLDRIFAVFQRLHNRGSYEGTGIGLAVCRKIAERHGGSITAKSTPGQGSTFIIMLPMRHKKGEQLL